MAQEEAIGDELLPEEAETPNADAPEEAAPEENAPDVETPDMDSSEAPSEDGAPEPDTEIPSTEDPSESEAPEPDTEIPSTEAPSDEVTDGSKPGDGSSETPGTETPGEGEPPAEGPAAPEQGAEGPGTEQPVQEPSVEEPAPEESAEMDTVEDYLEILAKANADRKGREVKELKSGKLKAAEWEAFAAEEGKEALHRKLSEVDPDSACAIHPNNVKRVVRALEYYLQNGETISGHNQRQRQKISPFNAAYFVLNDERGRLYQSIEARVDLMVARGLLEEVKKLKEMGCHRGMTSMQGLGYKEMLAFLDGEISFEEAVYILKRDTKHFAKRQLTWFHREKDVIWVDKGAFSYREDAMLDYMTGILKERGILR